jgi:hypothetical protein
MPWVIPPWLALAKFLLTAKENDEHDNDKARILTLTATTATATTATPTTGMVATMATTMKVRWMMIAAVTMTTTTMTSTTTMTTTRWDDNDGMVTMTMERRGWNNNNAMTMGLQMLCQPSEATINLCRQFGEESTSVRDNFGGRKDRKGSRWKQLGGDHFIST